MIMPYDASQVLLNIVPSKTFLKKEGLSVIKLSDISSSDVVNAKQQM